MVTFESLFAAGYREDLVPFISSASRFFQRRVSDEHGTRYFIDVYYYAPIPQIAGSGGFEVGVYLHHKDGTASETRIHNVTDLASAEQAADLLWTALECKYREVV